MKTCIPVAARLLILVLLLSGCAGVRYEYRSVPEVSRVETERFTAGFTPRRGEAGFYAWFDLVIENLGSTPIDIDWSNTRYLLDGKTHGGFVWEGIDPGSLKSNTVPKESISPGGRFERRISPLAKVAIAGRKEYEAGRNAPGLYSGILPAGENGVLLTLMVDGQSIRKKMTVMITESEKK